MLTMPDVALAAALLSLGGTLWVNRGSIPLHRAQMREADAQRESAAVQTMKTLSDALNEDNQRLHGELATLRERLGLITRWVAGLPRHLVPDEIRIALREDGAAAHVPSSAGDD